MEFRVSFWVSASSNLFLDFVAKSRCKTFSSHCSLFTKDKVPTFREKIDGNINMGGVVTFMAPFKIFTLLDPQATAAFPMK